jgi:uncharacterized protein (DUF1330 family)
MTVYVVLIRESVKDQKQYEEKYRRLVPASLQGRNAVPLAQSRASGMSVLEGPEIEGMAILTFPTMEEAKDWYDSPEYRAARKAREGLAVCRILVCEATDLSAVNGFHYPGENQ